jgi:hypothetical protein
MEPELISINDASGILGLDCGGQCRLGLFEQLDGHCSATALNTEPAK